MDENNKQLHSVVRKTFLRIFAYETLFERMYPDLHDCCDLVHKEFVFSTSHKLKCRNCAKYVVGKKFSQHLEKCIARTANQ